MTQAMVLSEASQDAVAQRAEQGATRSRESAKKSAKWGIGGFLAAAAATILFPPSGLVTVGVFVASMVGLIGTVHALGHEAAELSMKQVKKEVKEEGFLARLKNRATKLAKVSKVASFVSDVGLYTALPLALIAWTVPPVAVAAWGLYNAAIMVMGSGALVSMATRETKNSLIDVNGVAQALGEADTLSASVKPPAAAPSSVSNAPSLAPGFGLAANGNAPEAPAEDKAPAKPAVPKP